MGRMPMPAADARRVERLPDLGGARGFDRATGPVEREAGRVPAETAGIQQTPCLAFEVRDDRFIADLAAAIRRQEVATLLHQPFIMPIVAAEFPKMIGAVARTIEDLGIAGEAGVDRIAAAMNDAGIRQGQVDEAGIEEIARQLVDDPVCRRRQPGRSRGRSILARMRYDSSINTATSAISKFVALVARAFDGVLPHLIAPKRP